MDFNTVLDTFIRADESPITTNWTCPLFSGEGSLQIQGNVCVHNSAGFGGGWYDITTFGADSCAWTQINAVVNGSDCLVYDRIQDSPGTATMDGYCVQVKFQAGADIVRIRRLTNGTNTTLGADISATFAALDYIGIECIGDQISAWGKISGVDTLLGTRTDATYTTGGFLALELGDVVGNENQIIGFGGGTITPPPSNYANVAWFTA